MYKPKVPFKVYLFQLLLNSSCWLCLPWRPRCRWCAELQASVQSACTKCCHVPQGYRHWSPQQRCSSTCIHLFLPGLCPMKLSRYPLWLQRWPGWLENRCLNRKRESRTLMKLNCHRTQGVISSAYCLFFFLIRLPWLVWMIYSWGLHAIGVWMGNNSMPWLHQLHDSSQTQLFMLKILPTEPTGTQVALAKKSFSSCQTLHLLLV